MIRYKDLVEFIKEKHVNWDTELFCVLRDFMDWYVSEASNPPTVPASPTPPLIPPKITGWIPPADGEYTNEDVMNLFST